MRELASYSPKRAGIAIVIELEKSSEADVLALLSAVETCLEANEIPSVRIDMDGRAYVLAPH
jgi:hypothetical protein